MISWARTTDATVEPVTTSQQMTWLRLLNADNETKQMIDGIVSAARNVTERLCAVAMVTQTWAMKLDCFYDREILLPRYPVQSISSIQYYDTNNASQTFSSGSYRLGTQQDGMGIVQLNTDASWPSVYDRVDAITITFVAGYGAAASSVPPDLATAVKILASHFYENPTLVLQGSIQSEYPMSYDALIASFRRELPYYAAG